MSPLRVLVDASPLLVTHETGVSQFCRGLLAGLSQKTSIEISAFAMTRGRVNQLRATLPRGTDVAAFPVPVRFLEVGWRHLHWPPADWFLGSSDVVHGTNFVVPPVSVGASVVTVHDLTPVRFRELCDPSSLRFRELVWRAVRRGAWIHTPSHFVAAEVIEAFDADPSRVRAIWPGIPDPYGTRGLTAVRRATPVANLRGCHRYILAIGTADPRKDFPTLVAAFDRLAGDHPDLALVIIGSDGSGSGALVDAIQRARHRERVIRLGYVSEAELLTWLHAGAALAYPSRYEGFGFPPLMAMSAGVPVVATESGAVPEVVGDAAALVPVGDVDALAAALVAVLDGDSRAAGLIAAGRARARDFTWERCAAEMVGLYEAAAQTTSP
jgi:glycosyltransferase involved in cell wall biosynthesis